ncbi:unnamed protein product [Debaryomyces tyrocola]|nr:unnamed protein product [Debaryomyces tyrocola]
MFRLGANQVARTAGASNGNGGTMLEQAFGGLQLEKRGIFQGRIRPVFVGCPRRTRVTINIIHTHEGIN